jgi:outer membrane protein OmpA-like peptidoglycan-associated protein
MRGADVVSRLVVGALLVCVLAMLESQAGWSQVADPAPSAGSIIQALKPPKVRSIARGVNVQPGATGADTLPSINLKVNFAFNSAQLTTDAQLVLRNLGEALSDAALKDYRFRIAGHTDAVGGDDFNHRLSQERSKTVRDYLVFHYRIAEDRLVSEGFGKSRLFDPANPTSEINRRVEITNVGQ